MKGFILFVGLGLIGPHLAAQGPGRVGLRELSTTPATALPSSFAAHAIAPTHWKEGMIVGGAVGVAVGFGLVGLGHGLCDTQDCGNGDALVFVGSIVVFSLIGGLIGSAIAKH